VSAARGAILKDYYAAFYKAMGEEDMDRMTEIGNSILRLNGTADSIKKSAQGRNKNYGQPGELSEEQDALIAEAFGK